MKKLRIGVIGCGSIAKNYHVPALAKVQSAQLVYACDIIPERAANFKETFGFEKTTTDYKEILSDPDVDMVCIFTKIEMHAIIAIAAAKAKKQIFMQKPFAYNIAEGRSIIEAVKENGVRLIPSFMHSYFDGSIAATRIVASGKIGDIVNIRMRNATRNPRSTPESYGGCVMDIGCHGMDLIKTVSGADITHVFTSQLSPIKGDIAAQCGEEANLNGVEDTAILSYRLSNGATVSHEIIWSAVSQTVRFEMEVYGTKGSVYLYNPNREERVYVVSNTTGDPKDPFEYMKPELTDTFMGLTHHKLLVEDFLNGTYLSKDERAGFVPLQVVEAARRSYVSGKLEQVLGI